MKTSVRTAENPKQALGQSKTARRGAGKGPEKALKRKKTARFQYGAVKNDAALHGSGPSVHHAFSLVASPIHRIGNVTAPGRTQQGPWRNARLFYNFCMTTRNLILCLSVFLFKGLLASPSMSLLAENLELKYRGMEERWKAKVPTMIELQSRDSVYIVIKINSISRSGWYQFDQLDEDVGDIRNIESSDFPDD